MLEIHTRSTTALPDGVVTFLFTDVEGSTRLYEARPDAYRAALARHDAVVSQAVAAHGGAIFQHAGDSFAAAFTSAADALGAALQAQQALMREPPGEIGEIASLRVRMALHTGEVELQAGEYFGLVLHRCARLLSSAHGGQVILSAVTAGLVRMALPDGVSLRDLGEHRLRDLAQPERISQLVAPDLPTEHPPLRTLAASPNNLPVQLTPFIGRDQQQQAVREMLVSSDCRLVTLTGPGGTGKTRLALQAAADLLDRFPGGVYFVPLASISDPALVPSAIAQALDVRAASGRSVLDAVKDTLLSKQLLLILDNFEQVVDAASTVAELVGAAPNVKVLVTSRAILRLYGEREYPVPPLTLPDRRTTPGPAHLIQFEAVRLFADRARAARPDFALTTENAADVAEICHRLDGLPLALELAAARIRSLTPRAMLQRMERRLPLLTGGARDLPARQRTLRDTIAWSYDLLEPDEQALFRRLSLFRGFTLEMAEAVCAGEAVRPGAASVALAPLDLDVLNGVESLVEKSLLRQQDGVDHQPWYLMLETIRELALEQLEASGEAGAVHRRQARAALELAEAAESRLVGPEQAIWFARLEQEHDNLRTALGWSQEQGYATPALRLAVALWWFWSAHGHVKEGRSRVSSLLDRFPLKTPPAENPGRAALHAKLLWVAGMLASMEGDHVSARALHDEALGLRRALDDRDAVFNSLEALGTVLNFQGEYAAAEAYLGEALDIARDTGDREAMGMVLHALGNIKDELGDLDAARQLYGESLATLPASSSLLAPWLSVAAILLDQGKYDEAEAAANQALDRFREQGDRHVEALGLATLGGVALARGDYASAHKLLGDSLTIQRQHGNVPGVGQVLERFVGLAAAQGRLDGAMRIAGAAEALRQRRGGPIATGGRARLERVLAPVRQALGEPAAAEAWSDGQALDLDEAVAAALTIAEPAPTDGSVIVPPTPPPDPTSSASMRVASSAQAHNSPFALTRREREVAVLIAQGLTNRQIAESLVITEGTAANHVNHILEKLGFSSRAQVAAWVAASASESGKLPEGRPV